MQGLGFGVSERGLSYLLRHCLYKLGVLFVGVLIMRTLLLNVYISAPDDMNPA